jgi:hypothetical protein
MFTYIKENEEVILQIDDASRTTDLIHINSRKIISNFALNISLKPYYIFIKYSINYK